MDVKTNRFFAGPLHDYTARCLGGPVTLLQAGCLAPLRELGIGELVEGGVEISVTAVDADRERRNDQRPQRGRRDEVTLAAGQARRAGEGGGELGIFGNGGE